MEWSKPMWTHKHDCYLHGQFPNGNILAVSQLSHSCVSKSTYLVICYYPFHNHINKCLTGILVPLSCFTDWSWVLQWASSFLAITFASFVIPFWSQMYLYAHMPSAFSVQKNCFQLQMFLLTYSICMTNGFISHSIYVRSWQPTGKGHRYFSHPLVPTQNKAEHHLPPCHAYCLLDLLVEIGIGAFGYEHQLVGCWNRGCNEMLLENLVYWQLMSVLKYETVV